MRERKQANTNPERSLCSRSELVKSKRDFLSCFDCTSNHNGSECLVKQFDCCGQGQNHSDDA